MRFPETLARIALVAPGALLILAATPPPKQASWPTGIYSNIRMSGETGDLGGQEIQFYPGPDGKEHWVEFVFCEGWCNSSYKAQLFRDATGFRFEYAEPWFDGDGNVAETNQLRFHFRLSGKKLLLNGDATGVNGNTQLGPFTLKRASSLFGIDVANYKEK